MGVVATGALLAIFVSAVITFMPERREEAVVSAPPAATATPAPAKAKPKKVEPRFTAPQRRARRAAVTTLSGLGYRPVTLKTYDPDHVLRVLVGKGEGGQRAFFFVGGRYLGNDAADDSDSIEIARAGNRSVALAYRTFKTGDKACCPSGAKVRVLFRWDGKTLAPQTAIPPSAQRRAPAA
jgi:hypothetical protein